jgi:hypothetical protein
LTPIESSACPEGQAPPPALNPACIKSGCTSLLLCIRIMCPIIPPAGQTNRHSSAPMRSECLPVPSAARVRLRSW